MNRILSFALIIVMLLLALLLALLGVRTLPNPTGWFLVLAGVACSDGIIIIYNIRKGHFFEAFSGQEITHEKSGNTSFWVIILGLAAVLFLSPVEYLIGPATQPRNSWISFTGVGLVILGILLFAWARLNLKKSYSGHAAAKSGQTIEQSGPYRFIRHPAYFAYLIMALGISLGYSSLAGLASTLFILLPGLIYQIKTEEKMLIEHFGGAYLQYTNKTKHLIPGIW